MSGRDGARGYIYQGIAALLDCFENEDWDQIKLEPQTPEDKVDIMMMKGNVIIKAIQVKSSKNVFYGPSVEGWLNDLKKDVDANEYELILIGDCANSALKYCSQINGEKTNTRIVRKAFDDKELFKLAKGSVVEYLRKYHTDKHIHPAMIENIVNGSLKELLMSSTSETVYTKDDLQRMISANTINNQDKGSRIRIKSRITGMIGVLLWLLVSFGGVLYSGASIVPVSISIIVILLGWGLMKYSDWNYWNDTKDDIYEVHKTDERCGCPYVKIITINDSISWKQKVKLKNLSRRRIDKIKGKLIFYFHDTRIYVKDFCEYDIDADTEVVIDEISADAHGDFFERTYWDRVKLDILEIVLEGKIEKNWSGTIIWFSRIPDLEPIIYLKVFGVKILPYEMSWIYNNFVRKAMVYIPAFWRGPYRGFHGTDRWLNFKIKVIGFLKNTLCRIGVIVILLFWGGLFLVTIYGQVVVLIGVLGLIKDVLFSAMY